MKFKQIFAHKYPQKINRRRPPQYKQKNAMCSQCGDTIMSYEQYYFDDATMYKFCLGCYAINPKFRSDHDTVYIPSTDSGWKIEEL